MKRKRVSIVITCYNYGKFITRCLQSVVEQTFTDFEAVIVNDGSTDDSEEKIKPFLKDKRFKYIKQENAGQANAKNRGIRESTGEYVAFLDADDYWEAEKLEKQLPLFDNPRVGVVYSKARYVDEQGRDLRKKVEDFGKYLLPKSGYVVEDLLFDNFIPFSSSVVRRSILGDGFDEKLKMAIDWKLWLHLSVNWHFSYVNEKLVYYRMGHSGQMSKNIEERFRCTDKILNEFLEESNSLIQSDVLKKALAYKYYLRWEHFCTIDLNLAFRYLAKAIKYQIEPYRILKTLLKLCLGIKN